MILNIDHAMLNTLNHFIYKVAMLYSSNQVLIASNRVQCINRLESDCCIFSLQIYIFI